MPARLNPLEPVTTDALLTGDPRRAFALAQDLMVQPKMSHQARGLWGYAGVTPAGSGLTVQSTGVGGPGAIAVLGDLAGLGMSRAVRLGTCLSSAGGFPAGQALLIERALPLDGASLSFNTGSQPPEPTPDPGLFELLAGIAPVATVSSHDLVARFDPAGPEPGEGASVRDLQTAATFAMARTLGVEAAALLIVAGSDGQVELTEAELNELFLELGRTVVDRLRKT